MTTIAKMNLPKVIIVVFLLYVTFGQLELFIKFKVTNFIQVLLVLVLFISIFIKAKNNALISRVYYVVPFIPIAFVFLLIPSGENVFGDFSRICHFLLFILIVLFFRDEKKGLEHYVPLVVNFYFLFSFLIVVDAFVFLFLDFKLLFGNVYYLTYRFVGPFNDPNFMGFIYSILFVVIFFSKERGRIVRSVFFLLCVILSGSFSSIILLFFSILLSSFVFIKRAYLKPLLVIISIFFIVPLFVSYQMQISSFSYSLFYNLFSLDEQDFVVKFNSLLFRFEAVSLAVNYIYENPFGYGFRSILEYLPRDTHNSYIGMAFEYGVFVLFLIVFSMSFKITTRVSDILSSFLCFSGFLLNIHYMPVYFFALMVCFSKEVSAGQRSEA